MDIRFKVRPQIDQYELALLVTMVQSYDCGSTQSKDYMIKTSILSKLLKAQVSIGQNKVAGQIVRTPEPITQTMARASGMDKPTEITPEMEKMLMLGLAKATGNKEVEDKLSRVKGIAIIHNLKSEIDKSDL